MANTRELRRRIRSVKNTAQITKAMQMVAATKMRRAQNQAMAGRPYFENLNFSVSTLLPKVDISSHPLLRHAEFISASQETLKRVENARLSRQGDDKSIGVVLLTTNKSLCGALNTNLFRAVQNRFGSEKEVKYFSYGLKGRNFIVRTGKTLEADFENPETIMFRQARQISNLVRNAFLEGIVKEVYLAFPDFVSTLRQEPTIVKLLPIDPTALKLESSLEGQTGAHLRGESKQSPGAHLGGGASEFLFEPNVDELLDFV